MNVTAKRGHVYRIAMEPDVIVMAVIVTIDWLNDQRDFYSACQITTSRVHEGTLGAVRLKSGDPAFGYVICREVTSVYADELKEDLGPVSIETMMEIERSLRRVFGL